MSDLLPCPFCGAKPNEYTTEDDNIFDETNYIYRIVCECLANPVCYVSTIDESEISGLKKSAIKAWNTRFDHKCASPNCDCAIKCNKQLAQNEKLD